MQSQLRRIKSIAEDIKFTHLTAPLILPKKNIEPVDIAPLQLVIPHHLRPSLGGLNAEIAAEVTQAFDKAAAIASEHLTLTFEKTSRQLSSIEVTSGCLPLSCLLEKLRRAFQDTYEGRLRSWIEELIPAVATRFASAHPQTTGQRFTAARQISTVKKPTFHHEYVPLLEKYFGFNPFPSQADKSLLAKKSAMTYRQIDVWFQNRRSRAKKDGQTLKKLASHEDSKISYQLLEQVLGDKLLPENERVDLIDSDVSEYEWQYDSDEEDMSAWNPGYKRHPEEPDVLDKPPPPHAFPSVYPPTCAYEPFPTKGGKYTFPPPVWMRHPTVSSERRPVVDFDKLIEDFSKMSVRDGPRKRWVKKDPRRPTDPKRTRPPSPRPDRSAATMFITTRPLPAPIPAFIRPTAPIHVTLHSPSINLLPRASPTPTHASSTPSPVPLQASPVSSGSPTAPPAANPPRRRKIAPLPRRTPAGTSATRREVTPAAPETRASSPVPSSSHSSISRKSSFGSDYSSQSRISSGSSSASSVVATPEPEPASLPEIIVVPSIHQDSQGILSDPSSGRLSPVPGIQLSLPSEDDLHIATKKQPFSFTFTATALRP